MFGNIISEKDFQVVEKRNYAYMLIHTAEMDSLPEVDLFLRNPQTKEEAFTKEFSVFLVYRKLRYLNKLKCKITNTS